MAEIKINTTHRSDLTLMKMTRRHVTMTTILMCVLGLSMLTPVRAYDLQTPPNQSASTRTIMGMETWSSPDALVKQVAGVGAAWLRRNALLWSAVEPAEGQRDWQAVAALESELKAATKNRLNTILIIRSTPAWAQQAGKLCGAVRGDKMLALGVFMRDVVARYSKAPFNIAHFEFGNEPDVNPALVASENPFGCWGDPSDPYFGGGYYAEALKAIHPQLKAANPKAQLLIGGLLMDCDPTAPPQGKDCRESRFFEGILRAGGGAYFDIVSFHGYDFYEWAEGAYTNKNWGSQWNTTGPVLLRKAQFLRDVMKTYNVNKPLMCTEVAVICWDCLTTTPEFERTKANYVPQAYAAAKAANLLGAIWYNWEGWNGTAMVDAAGQPTLANKAFAVASANLGRATFVRERTDLPGARAYEFIRGGRRFWVMWPANGTATDVTLPAVPARVFNALGEQQKPAKALALATPLYVEWR